MSCHSPWMPIRWLEHKHPDLLVRVNSRSDRSRCFLGQDCLSSKGSGKLIAGVTLGCHEFSQLITLFIHGKNYFSINFQSTVSKFA